MQLLGDLLWAAVSVAVVTTYVFAHTRSPFACATSMSLVGFAIPIALVLYRNVAGVTNVSALHLTVLFVVLGLAADNIFVVWDAWRQSAALAALGGD